MSRYIDADKFEGFGYGAEARGDHDVESFDEGVGYVLEKIWAAPTIEPADIIQSQWISAEDQLPEPEKDVLACTQFKSGDREILFAMYEDGTITSENSRYGWNDWLFPHDAKIPKGWWVSDRDMHNADDVRDGMVYGTVTYWMPVPKLPKES